VSGGCGARSARRTPEAVEKEVAVEKVIVAVSAALAVGVSALATAWVQSRIGSAGAGALAEKPELRGSIIVMLAIPETLVILGFVIAVLILTGG
jgi:V/A-type H+-transporting ATPase subunit K